MLNLMKEVIKLNGLEDWQTFKSGIEGLVSYKRKGNGGLTTVKGVVHIDRNVKDVMGHIKFVENRALYDESLEREHIIENLGDSMQLVYLVHKSQIGIPKRDYCVVQRHFELSPGRFSVLSMSVETPKCP